MAKALEGLIDELNEKLAIGNETILKLRESQQTCNQVEELYPQLWEKYSEQFKKIQSIDFPDMYEITSGLKSSRAKLWKEFKNQIKLREEQLKDQSKRIEELVAETTLCGMIHNAVMAAVDRGEVLAEITTEKIISEVAGAIDLTNVPSETISDITTTIKDI